ncbi:MAG: NUDIX domain-containing protein [Oscillospiraceae bacterium]|jgi:8-oxo-dGTP diphosphatase|nr:NUDIX domain-containing protein [Oscillospiraceae bacterium]
MIILDNCATAFLKRGDEYLLMKRAANRKIAPGLWSGPGGHLEPHELNEPRSACLREVMEETGISAEHISDLRLRYIILRRRGDSIRQHYVYFGATDAVEFADCGEGTLHWIPEAELFKREFTETFEAMLRHYTSAERDNERVVAGVAGNVGGRLHMLWSAVEDFV